RDRADSGGRARPDLRVVPAALRPQADAVLRRGGGGAVLAGLPGGPRRAVVSVRAGTCWLPTAARLDPDPRDLGYCLVRLRLRGRDGSGDARGSAGAAAGGGSPAPARQSFVAAMTPRVQSA